MSDKIREAFSRIHAKIIDGNIASAFSIFKEGYEAGAALAQQPAQPTDEHGASDYPPCDYCGAEVDYMPWHGSGPINGVESRHIHACDHCRNLLPSAEQPDTAKVRELLRMAWRLIPGAEGMSEEQQAEHAAWHVAVSALLGKEGEA